MNSLNSSSLMWLKLHPRIRKRKRRRLWGRDNLLQPSTSTAVRRREQHENYRLHQVVDVGGVQIADITLRNVCSIWVKECNVLC